MKETFALPPIEDLIDKRKARKLFPELVQKAILNFSLSPHETIILKAAYGTEVSPTYDLFREHFPEERYMVVYKFKYKGKHYLGQLGFDYKDKIVATRTVEPFHEATALLPDKGAVYYPQDLIKGRYPELMGFERKDPRIRKYVYMGF